LPEKICSFVVWSVGKAFSQSTPSALETNGQSMAKRMRSVPISSMQQRRAESEKNPLVVM
jgi:hypothetical protein